MKVFCYFVEPALYSIDLASNVYDKKNIDYCFIKSTTFTPSNLPAKASFLDKKNFIERIRYIYNIYKSYDLIIVNGYNNYPFILSFIFNVFSNNKKYIATESDTQFSIPRNFIKRLIKWIYLSTIFNHKYVLGFAGGSNSHKDLFRNYGMDEDRVFLMPMMVDNSRFYCNQKKFPKLFTFLYVGRLESHKGVEGLIQQFNNRFHNKRAVLKVVGAGTCEIDLKKRYESKNVIFLGKKLGDDLIEEFKQASCFVCPSIFEPWGLVINEALSASLPVIATKEVGACFDLITQKRTGMVSNNMNDFGEKMLKLFNDRKLLQEFSKNAKLLMIDKWNYNLYIECLNNVIIKIKHVF